MPKRNLYNTIKVNLKFDAAQAESLNIHVTQ